MTRAERYKAKRMEMKTPKEIKATIDKVEEWINVNPDYYLRGLIEKYIKDLKRYL